MVQLQYWPEVLPMPIKQQKHVETTLCSHIGSKATKAVKMSVSCGCRGNSFLQSQNSFTQEFSHSVVDEQRLL